MLRYLLYACYGLALGLTLAYAATSYYASTRGQGISPCRFDPRAPTGRQFHPARRPW